MVVNTNFAKSRLTGGLVSRGGSIVLVSGSRRVIHRTTGGLSYAMVRTSNGGLTALRSTKITTTSTVVLLASDSRCGVVAYSLVSSICPTPVGVTHIHRCKCCVGDQRASVGRTSTFANRRHPLCNVSFVVRPSVRTTSGIVDTIGRNTITSILSFSDSCILSSLAVTRKDSFTNVTLGGVHAVVSYPFIVTCLRGSNHAVLPDNRAVLGTNSHVKVFSTRASIPGLLSMISTRIGHLHGVIVFNTSEVNLVITRCLLDHPEASLFGEVFNGSRRALTRGLIVISSSPRHYERTDRGFPRVGILYNSVASSTLVTRRNLSRYSLIITLASGCREGIIITTCVGSLNTLHAVTLTIGNPFTGITHGLNISITVPVESTMVSDVVDRLEKSGIETVRAVKGKNFRVIRYSIRTNDRFTKGALERVTSTNDFLILLTHPSNINSCRLTANSAVLSINSRVILVTPTNSSGALTHFKNW